MADLIMLCPNCGAYKHPVSGNHFPHCGACPPPGPDAGEPYRRIIADYNRPNQRRLTQPQA